MRWHAYVINIDDLWLPVAVLISKLHDVAGTQYATEGA